jgi:HSF-type DNA-binding
LYTVSTVSTPHHHTTIIIIQYNQQPSFNKRIIIMCLGPRSRQNNVSLGYLPTDAALLRPRSPTISQAPAFEAAKINLLEPAKPQRTLSDESYGVPSATQKAAPSDGPDRHRPTDELHQKQSPSCGAANKRGGVHIIVQHDYHDHSHDRRVDYQEEHPARGGVSTPFPLRLHEMLDNAEGDGFDDVVSWQPHGRCFAIHKPKEFVELLPSYFKLSKMASFQRQLNLYGFQRLTRGRDRGGYYHELFIRDREFLAHSIHRMKVKGTGVRARSNPDQEPDFWGMEWIPRSGGHRSNNHYDVATPPPSSSSAAKDPPDLSFQGQAFPSSLYSSVDGTTFLTSSIAPRVPSASVESSDYGQHRGAFDGKFNQGSMVEEDIVCAFGNKTFHYLDPFKPISLDETKQAGARNHQSYWQQQRQPGSMMHWAGQEALLDAEAESFFEDFQFPDDIGAEIENDGIFGEMLQSLITS